MPTCASSWRRCSPDRPTSSSARFTGRLQFGTAGLRGAVGAGPLRMNRLVVRQAAAGLVDHLLATVPDAAERGVIIGYDARRKSDVFALDTARVCAAAWREGDAVPARRPHARARLEHRRHRCRSRRDGDGEPQPAGRQRVQGVPRHGRPDRAAGRRADRRLHRRRRPVCGRTVRGRPSAHRGARSPELESAYLASVPGVRFRPDVSGTPVAYTALHGVGGAVLLAAFERAGLRPPVVVAEQQEPDGTFPTVGFPNPEEPGAMDRVIALAAVERGAGRHRQRSRCRSSRRSDPHPLAGTVAVGLAQARRRRDRVVARRSHPPTHRGRRPSRRHDARVVVAAGADGRAARCALGRDVHGLQVDRPHGARAPRASGSCSATSRHSATW